jgi:hypothetical protein
LATPATNAEPAVAEPIALSPDFADEPDRLREPNNVALAEQRSTESSTPGAGDPFTELGDLVAAAGTRLAEMQAKLRDHESQGGGGDVEGDRQTLVSIGRELLADFQRILDSLSLHGADDDEAKANRRQKVSALLLDQVAQLETTISNLEHKYDDAASPVTANDLLRESERIRLGNMKLAACLR